MRDIPLRCVLLLVECIIPVFTCWGLFPRYIVSIRSIFKIQNNGSTRTYFKGFNILQLPEIYNFKLSSMFAKYIKDGLTSNDYVSNYLQLNSDFHSYNTRIRDSFSVPYFRRSASKSYFIYKSTNKWNSLPDDVKQK